MKSKRLFSMLVILLGISLAASCAFADCDCVGKVTSDQYSVRAPARLVHGIINAGLGWTELIVQPIYAADAGQNVLHGVADGIGDTVYYTILGVWDVATFWLPGEVGKKAAAREGVLMTYKNNQASGCNRKQSSEAASQKPAA